MMNGNRILKTLWIAFLAILMVSCNKEGDETISLEYGNPRKMIIGEWVVTKCQKKYDDGRIEEVSNDRWVNKIFTFFDNGTYTDSSDNSKKHKWQLTSNNEDGPYYGGISLDGTSYDIVSLGNGHWILGKPGEGNYNYGWYWELDKGFSPAGEENGNSTDKIVKIVRTEEEKLLEAVTHSFGYDNRGRISRYTVVDGRVLADYNYSYEAQTLRISGSDSYVGYLNSNGYLYKSDGIVLGATYDAEYLITLFNSKYTYTFEYGSTGNLNTIRYKYVNSSFSSICNTFEYGSEKNDANINLSYYVIMDASYIFSGEAFYLFFPFDLYGKRSTNLVSKMVFSDGADFYYKYAYERDKKGRISGIICNRILRDNSVSKTINYAIYYE